MIAYKAPAQLYKTRLRNPFPPKVAETMDVISARNLATYTLVAATVADSDTARPVTPPPRSKEPKRKFNGKFTIRVVDDVTGKPIAGALVQPGMTVLDECVVAPPFCTSSAGKGTVPYPIKDTTLIFAQVEKQGYQPAGKSWESPLPDSFTFRLTPIARTLLRWKFKPGETLDYVITQEWSQKIQKGDKAPMTGTMKLSMDNVWKVESVDNEGVATINRTIDRMRMKVRGPHGVHMEFDTASDRNILGPDKIIAQVAKAMVKKVTVLRISPLGEVLEAKPPQGLLEGMKKILPVGSFGDLFSPEGLKKMQVNIPLPAEPVARGRTWTHKEDFQLPAMFGRLGVEEKYECLGSERHGGVEFQKIALTVLMGPGEAKQVEKAEGEQEPVSPLVKFKDSDSRGTIYFDNVQGRVVRSTMKVNVQAEINIAGKGGMLDMNGTLRIELRPQEDKPRAKPVAKQPAPVPLGSKNASKQLLGSLTELLSFLKFSEKTRRVRVDLIERAE